MRKSNIFHEFQIRRRLLFAFAARQQKEMHFFWRFKNRWCASWENVCWEDRFSTSELQTDLRWARINRRRRRMRCSHDRSHRVRYCDDVEKIIRDDSDRVWLCETLEIVNETQENVSQFRFSFEFWNAWDDFKYTEILYDDVEFSKFLIDRKWSDTCTSSNVFWSLLRFYLLRSHYFRFSCFSLISLQTFFRLQKYHNSRLFFTAEIHSEEFHWDWFECIARSERTIDIVSVVRFVE